MSITPKHQKNITSHLLNHFNMCVAIVIVLTSPEEPQVRPTSTNDIALCVLVIDMGLADSILVMLSSGETMLIDAAEKSETGTILEELNERGITHIDILVATHSHADYIGGMASVIEAYEIGKVYMSDKQSDTKTYKNLMDVIANTEFLFTGDMEEEAEEDMLEAGYDINVDVLKVAHHGSSTGTSEDFLYEASPDYVTISCGLDNKYGHPHKETLELFDKYGLVPIRTDLSGDILFISDRNNIAVILRD